MTEKTKNFLGIAIIVSILVVAFSAWSAVRTYSRSVEPSSFRSFSVSGEGEIIAVPDVAEFSFSVITQGGTNLVELQRVNTEKTNEAISFLKSQGIEAKDIKTQSYNLEPRYQYFSCPRDGGPCPPPKIVGYTITQTVFVKIRDFSKIGGIFSGVVDAGANSVSQLTFTIDNPEQVQAEARQEAINQAKEKAKAIAKAAGFNLGRLLSINESVATPPIPIFQEAFLNSGSAAKTPTIEPGSQEVKVNVSLTYEIR